MNCQMCNTPIAQRQRGRHRLFCSDPCRRTADAQRKAARAASKKHTTCGWCGAPMTPKASAQSAIEQPARGRERYYCSEPCRRAQFAQKRQAHNVKEVIR